MISLWASGLLYPAEVMKLSWFCCVWHLAGLRCTPCRGGLSLCSPGDLCRVRPAIIGTPPRPRHEGNAWSTLSLLFNHCPLIACCMWGGWLTFRIQSLTSFFVFDQSCAFSMFSLFISYDHLNHMNHLQKLHYKTLFHPCFWHNYLVGWRHKMYRYCGGGCRSDQGLKHWYWGQHQQNTGQRD